MQGPAGVQRIVELTLRTTSDTKGVDEFTRSARQAAIAAGVFEGELTEGEKAAQEYTKDVNAATTANTRFGQGLQRGRVALSRFGQGLRQAREEASGANRQLGQLARTAAAGFGFAVAIRNARDFSTQIAEVATLVDTAVTPQEQLASSVRNLSDEFGRPTEEVSRGLYQAISSGAVTAAESNEFLNTALRLATAGVTDTETAVNGLTTILNAFNIPAEEAGRVSDVLFATVRAGKTDVEELSSFIFQAAPLASALGVGFEEVNAALVGLTAQGTPTRVAFTQVRAALQGVIRPTEELEEIFQRAGFASGEAAVASEGLQGTLQILQEATGGSASQLQALLGSVEAVQGVLGLTGQNAERFADALDAVTNSAGATDEAFEKVDETLGTTFNKTIEQLNNALADIGRAFEPVIRAFLAVVRAGASVIEFFATTFPNALQATIIALTGLLIVNQVRNALRLFRRAAELAGLAQGSFAATTEVATVAQRKQLAVTRLLNSALDRLAGAIGLIVVGYEIATAAIDKIIERNDQAIQQIRRTTDITREILALRQRAEALGADPDELEQQIQFLEARAFRPGTTQAQREAILSEVRDILEERVTQAEELADKIAEEEQRITQIQQQEAQNQRRIFQQNIVDRQEAEVAAAKVAISETRKQVREQERLEKESIKRRQEILKESADFQKQINEDIAAAIAEVFGIEAPSAEVEQAQRVLRIRQQIVEQGKLAETAISSAQAEEIQGDVQKLRAEAEKVDSAEQRLLFLREIQRLEQQVAERGAGLAALEADTAAQEQERLKQSLVDQTAAVKDLNEALKESRKALEDLPPIQVTADVSDVEQKISILERRLRDIGNTRLVVTAEVQSGAETGGQLQKFARGGDIRSGRKIPGFGGGDRVHFIGERGEWVINKRRSAEFSSLLNRINSGSRASVQRMIDAMASVPRHQEGGQLGAGIAGGALSELSPREQITQRVALDLSTEGREFGTLFGESTVVEGLIDALRDTRRGVVRR